MTNLSGDCGNTYVDANDTMINTSKSDGNSVRIHGIGAMEKTEIIDYFRENEMQHVNKKGNSINGNITRMPANGMAEETENNFSKATNGLLGNGHIVITDETNERAVFLGQQPIKEEQVGVFKKLLSDDLLRHKLLHTICSCLAMVALGWRLSITGPTLPDLRLITNESLSRISWIISAIALGGLVGCIICGFLYDRLNKYAIYISLLVVFATVSALTPWCSNFITMVIIHVLNGICAGGIDTVVAADVVLVWGQKSASFQQAVYFAFSIGATFSPVTSEPFMAKPLQRILKNTTSDIQTTTAINNNSTDSLVIANIDQLVPGQTNIHYAFIISAGMCGLACACFVLLLCTLGNVYRRKTKSDDETVIEHEKFEYALSRKWQLVFIAAMSVMLAVYVVSERHYYNYLMSFLVHRMNWTKTQGSNATTIFWLTFAVGRLISIFIVRILKLIYVFVVFLFILLLSEIVLYIGVQYDVSSLLWLSFVLHGFGMSALCANILSWLSTNICPLTGKITGGMFTVAIIGSMIFPLVAGNVMSSLSYDWFIYLDFILSSIFVLLVIFVEVLHRCLRRK